MNETPLTLRVLIDADRCIGSGACVQASPEVFAQDDSGIVVLVDPSPAGRLADEVREAEAACPAQVITVVAD